MHVVLLYLKATGSVFMAFIFSKHGCITLNVIDLANTLHALGPSAYSVREVYCGSLDGLYEPLR